MFLSPARNSGPLLARSKGFGFFEFGESAPDSVDSHNDDSSVDATLRVPAAILRMEAEGLGRTGVPVGDTHLSRQGGDPTLAETGERPVGAWNSPGGYADRETLEGLSPDELLAQMLGTEVRFADELADEGENS